MCISRDHLEFLDALNEADFRQERIGYETYVRFNDQADRCRACSLLDNGRQGDMLEDCRLRLLRFFIAGRRDDEKRLGEAPPASGA